MICGLLGQKLGHSYSPQIHQKLSDYSYQLFEKEPEQIEKFLKSEEFQGLNVTIPYKKTVIPYCDSLTNQARKIGAVNTIVRRPDGTLIGHNTDYFGFSSMAQRTGVNFAGKKVLILGSGGASNTVCCVMKELGAKVVVISRNGENNYQNLPLHKDCAAIVNTTPVGMYPHTGSSPLDISIFSKLECVMDLIYNPLRTKLLSDAQDRGIVTENGLWMLVAQAKESAEWFMSQTIADEKIEEIYRQLKTQKENIVLIGMPGSGKSTTGRLLAEKLWRKYIDSDSVIEDKIGKPIREFLCADNEQEFRKIETEVLSEVCSQSDLVIATGGGCVTIPENLPILRQNGKVIWIKRDISQLSTAGRPLSQQQKLSDMYRIRKPLYEKFSDFTVDNTLSIEETVQSILNEVYL